MNNKFRIPQVSVLWTDTVRVEASWKSGRCNFFREKKRLNRRSDRKNFHIIETGSMGLAVERCWWFFVFTTNTKAVTRFLSPLPHFVIFCWSWVNDLQVIRVFSARKANFLLSLFHPMYCHLNRGNCDPQVEQFCWYLVNMSHVPSVGLIKDPWIMFTKRPVDFRWVSSVVFFGSKCTKRLL